MISNNAFVLANMSCSLPVRLLCKKCIKKLARSQCHRRINIYVNSSASFGTSSQAHGWKPKNPKGDPLVELQPFVLEPIIKEADNLFQPTEQDIKTAQKLFYSASKKNSIKIHKGVVDLSNLPDYNIPEVAFIGRSNVGKSSLINALFHGVSSDVNMRVSKKPGHTKVLKLVQVGHHFTLVDMPGYGHNMPEHFVQSVEGYFSARQRLTRTFLLIDGEVGMTSTDEIGIEMLEEFARPYVMVLTKIDKTSQHQLIRKVLQIQKFREDNMPSCFPQPFLVSSHLNAGIAKLQAFIAYSTGNLVIKGH